MRIPLNLVRILLNLVRILLNIVRILLNLVRILLNLVGLEYIQAVLESGPTESPSESLTITFRDFLIFFSSNVRFSSFVSS